MESRLWRRSKARSAWHLESFCKITWRCMLDTGLKPSVDICNASHLIGYRTSSAFCGGGNGSMKFEQECKASPTAPIVDVVHMETQRPHSRSMTGPHLHLSSLSGFQEIMWLNAFD